MSPAAGTLYGHSRPALPDGPDQPGLRSLVKIETAFSALGWLTSMCFTKPIPTCCPAHLQASPCTICVHGYPLLLWSRIVDDHLRSPQSLVHMCFKTCVQDLLGIRKLLLASHPVLATSVTSVELTIHPRAFFPPDMDDSMAGQHFHHLWAWFTTLQHVHIHLHCSGRQLEEAVLISAAWLPAHCRLVVTHKRTCSVHVVKCPSGCLSLSLSSCPAQK